MQRLNKLFETQKIGIILLLILTGIFFYLRSVNRELYCDEIMYGYKLNATIYGEYWISPTTALDGEIKTVGDVISSQYNHYFYGNGRSVAHFIEQLFTGVLGVNLFYLLNTCLFISTIILFVRKYLNREYYLSWMFAIIVFLYLFPFPSKLWYSINLAPNYLMPLSMILLLFYQWDKLKDNDGNASKIVLCTAPIVGLLAGWSNEAFAIPVAGAIFIHYLFNIKRISPKVLLLAVPQWLGTIIMVLSPGNLSRFMKSSGDGGSKLLEVLEQAGENLLQLKLLWILVAIVILYLIFNRRKIIVNLKENAIVVYSIILGLIFGLIANTAVHSFTAIEFFAMILLCSLIAPQFAKIKYKRLIAVIVTSLFCIHQTMIVDAENKQVKMQRALIDEYVSNKGGVVMYDNSYLNTWTKPYVTTWELDGFELLYDSPFRYKYGDFTMRALSEKDYNALSVFNVLSPNRKKAKGDTKFYYFGGKLFLANAHNVKKNQKFIMRIQGGKDPLRYKEIEVELHFLSSTWGYFYAIEYPTEGTPIGIYLKK